MLLPLTGAFGAGACCSTNWRACSGSSWAWEPNWWNGSRKLLISMVKSFRWWSLSGDRQAVGGSESISPGTFAVPDDDQSTNPLLDHHRILPRDTAAFPGEYGSVTRGYLQGMGCGLAPGWQRTVTGILPPSNEEGSTA